MSKYKVASFFAGVGGIDLGFEQSGFFKTIYANEYDKYPAETMQFNFERLKVDTRDIKDIDVKTLPNFDVMLAGFPCQSFSVAGLRQGFKDSKGRGDLFFNLVAILDEKKPKALLFENVKNLLSHDKGKTFKVVARELSAQGYFFSYKVLNAMDYANIPQTRECIYIVGFKEKTALDAFLWPERAPLKKSVKDIIDFENRMADCYYYVKGKYKGEIYAKLVEAMLGDDIEYPGVYQWRRTYVRKNKKRGGADLDSQLGRGWA